MTYIHIIEGPIFAYPIVLIVGGRTMVEHDCGFPICIIAF